VNYHFQVPTGLNDVVSELFLLPRDNQGGGRRLLWDLSSVVRESEDIWILNGFLSVFADFGSRNESWVEEFTDGDSAVMLVSLHLDAVFIAQCRKLGHKVYLSLNQ
jgi:hypothetical protein